jgi:hypothetical protein
VEAATLKAQKKKQNVAIAEWERTPMKNERKIFFTERKILRNKFLEGKKK